MRAGEEWVAASLRQEREERRNAEIDYGPRSSDEEDDEDQSGDEPAD